MAGGSRPAAVQNDYAGWTPNPLTHNPGAQVPRVEMASLTPERFFAKYVSSRRPVVIAGYLDHPDHAGSLAKWTDPAYLRSKAGACEVRSQTLTDFGLLCGQCPMCRRVGS
jgi:hypothetical protein